MKTITYYFSPQSPWAYLGHDQLMAMAEKYQAEVLPRPCAFGTQVFPVSGGLPLKQRPAQRQEYRLVELKRWSEFRGLPLNVHPQHFPIDETIAARMIAATIKQEGNGPALALTGALFRAIWAQERNIADADTLIEIGNQCGLDGAKLYANLDSGSQLFEQYTQEAIANRVFGAPWYVYEGEPFWGQDRLDFLERALARTGNA